MDRLIGGNLLVHTRGGGLNGAFWAFRDHSRSIGLPARFRSPAQLLFRNYMKAGRLDITVVSRRVLCESRWIVLISISLLLAACSSDPSYHQPATATVPALVTSGSSEGQIRSVVERSVYAISARDANLFNESQCAGKRVDIAGFSSSEQLASLEGINLRSVSNVRVTENVATAQMHFSYRSEPDKELVDDLTLVREGGRWLVC